MLDSERSVYWIELSLEEIRMFGKRESAQATVLYVQDVTGHRFPDDDSVKMEFVLEVHPPSGQAFRATTTHQFVDFTPYPKVGDVVNVKYDPKSLKAELDLKDDLRYGEKGEKRKEQARRQAAQAQRDALLAAPPGTPLSSPTSTAGAGMASLDPEVRARLQQSRELLEAARAQQHQTIEQRAAPGAQVPAGFPGMAAPTHPQAAMGLPEMQRLRQALEDTGASGQAKILRKQQAGAPVQQFVPFFVEVLVQPDALGVPFTCTFTTWIDTSQGMLLEGYTLPVKYDPQNPARMVFLLPA